VVLTLSLWLAVDNASFLTLLRLTSSTNLQVPSSPSLLEYGAYLLVVAGALMVLLGFLGCCGAALESRGLLTTYGLLIAALFAVQVAGGVMAALYRPQAQDEVELLLKASLQQHYSTARQPNAVSLAWDAVMRRFDCCGVNNYTDFEKAVLWQTNKTFEQVMPAACCIQMPVKSQEFNDNDDGVYIVDFQGKTLSNDIDTKALNDDAEVVSKILAGTLPSTTTEKQVKLLPNKQAELLPKAVVEAIPVDFEVELPPLNNSTVSSDVGVVLPPSNNPTVFSDVGVVLPAPSSPSVSPEASAAGSQGPESLPLPAAQRRRNPARRKLRQKRLRECETSPSLENSHYLTGCYGRLKTWTDRNTSVLLYAATAGCVVQLMLIVFALALCCSVRKYRAEEYYREVYGRK